MDKYKQRNVRDVPTSKFSHRNTLVSLLQINNSGQKPYIEKFINIRRETSKTLRLVNLVAEIGW